MNGVVSSGQPIAVIGCGAMGSGIAQVAACAGHTVKLFDARPGGADAAVTAIRKALGRLEEKGKLSGGHAESIGRRLIPVSCLVEIADSTLVIEAIVEDLRAKQSLFEEVEKLVTHDCVLASNTSSISITAIAAVLRHPERFLGMHFFNPVPSMPLVEVISGLATSREVASTVFNIAAEWKKFPVHARSTPGFIVNRIARPFYGEALRILNERAADVATIDAIMRNVGGFRMGPFELMDLIGHDVNYAVTCSMFESYYGDPRFTPSLIQKELVDAGYLGRKTGRGFYKYGNDAPAIQPLVFATRPSPATVTVNSASKLAMQIAGRLDPDKVKRVDKTFSDSRLFEVDEAVVYLTDGRTATERGRRLLQSNVVLLDLALDFSSGSHVAVTCSDVCDVDQFHRVISLLQSASYSVMRLDDVPGMAVMRTVAMLANEAADALNQGVCSPADLDLAMKKGVNYPRGPLEWGDDIGLDYLLSVLANLAATYGEDRYRPSPLLRRRVAAGATFYH